MPKTLYETLGSKMPAYGSAERTAMAVKAGIDPNKYIGSAEQNALIVKSLSTPTNGNTVDPTLAQKSGQVNTAASGGTGSVPGIGTGNANLNGPSSSNSSNIQNATNAAIVNATTPAQKPTLTEAGNWYAQEYGFTPEEAAKHMSTPEQRISITNMYNEKKLAEDTAEQAKREADASYAMEAGKQDQEWKQYLDKIETQRTGALSQANAVSYAANPYAATGTATGDLSQVINKNYNTQIVNAKTQYDYAKEMLRQGKVKEYSAAMQALNKSVAESTGQYENVLNQLAQRKLTENAQALTQKNINQDNLMKMVDTYSSSPALQGDLDSFTTSGTVSPALEPFFKTGKDAGLAPNEVASMLKYGTDKARYQQRQLNLQEARLQMQMDKQTAAQYKLQTQASIANTSTALINRGILPGTVEYALGVANATAGSAENLNKAESDMYVNVMSVTDKFNRLKENLDKVNTKSTGFNLIVSKAGTNIQSLADKDLTILNAEINSLAGPIGKGIFSESGNMSNTDIQRIIGALPSGGTTAEVRNSLYKEIKKTIADKVTNQLTVDATRGKNVANFAPYVQEVVNKANEGITDTKNVPSDIQAIFNKYKK